MAAAAGASLLAYILTSFIAIISYFFFFPPNSKPKYQYATSPAYLRPLLSLLVLSHTLFILYEIFLDPPANLFTALNVPLTYPADSIRSLLLMLADDPASGLPSGIERVLTRLGSAAMRLLYVRFGHEAIATCEHCSSWSDFALYALPGALLDYLREIMIMGILTLRGTRHTQHRTLGVGVLSAAAMLETYIVLTIEINIPKESDHPNNFWRSIERLYGGHGVVMWHDALLLARRILFLALPVVVHFVLKPSPVPPSVSELSNPIPIDSSTGQALPEYLALNTLQSLTGKLQLLRLTRGAIPRNPTLSARAENYWATERQEGEWLRADGEVRKVARGIGLGFEEAADGENGASHDGPLLRQVKTAIQNLLAKGFIPSPFWKPSPPSGQTVRNS